MLKIDSIRGREGGGGGGDIPPLFGKGGGDDPTPTHPQRAKNWLYPPTLSEKFPKIYPKSPLKCIK